MKELDLQPIILSFKLAIITSILLLLIGIPVAFLLSRSTAKFKFLFEGVLSLPLVLPPSVLGFYLLLVLGSKSPIGSAIESLLGLRLVFSFEGIVVASIIYSFPFMVQPIQTALERLPNSLTEASYILGKSELQTLLKVQLPNIRPAILVGFVLSFAHTIGEFGVVLMIGGNIPGETRVAALAVYDEVESLNYGHAHIYSLILLISSFTIITIVYWINRTKKYFF